ncbi:hypothetical protein [Aquibacillus saliphilus]|uniref:hypothetical protein n=1 Tax=Aquibacillus saliphilus TaxID=1909422 RepID=UPI001CEFBD2B|nr:hypothetical protein [Aquibacillus saliphilus]
MKYREDKLLEKYQEITDKKNDARCRGNGTMANIYDEKLKIIRMALGLLEIHIDGINR